MADTAQEQTAHLLDRYPWRIILFRWFLVAAEMGLATYSVLKFKMEIGLIFLVYGVICVFLLLPAIRCVRCYYYGKRCNFGWGQWISKIFPQETNDSFSSLYGYTILFWPLRIIPFGLGLMIIMGSVRGEPQYLSLGLFAAYLLVIFIHHSFYRRRACSRCHEKGNCPVYDKRIMSSLIEKSEPI